MEMTMNPVINFINKAVEKKMKITVSRSLNTQIVIWGNEDNIEFKFTLYDKVLDKDLNFLEIYVPYHNEIKIDNLSELDILNFKGLAIVLEEYSKNNAIEIMDKYFENNDKQSKIVNINDLDNEDE